MFKVNYIITQAGLYSDAQGELYIITQAGLYSDAQGELHYYTGRSV